MVWNGYRPMTIPRFLLHLTLAAALHAQVYSPRVLRDNQPDASNLERLAQGIYAQSGARTPRARAEAIWRFFLTDGRFVKPGMFYHIAGWAYEEPTGEVLDPLKLLNSYGFGLCYHIAPLLEAVFEAGGFDDARCWFLTGHTVAEVFYDGAYHYFDSDMMGYNVAGADGSFRGKPVVSVHDLERSGAIILDKLQSPNAVKSGVVDNPWYPADVRARAMPDLAGLFTSTSDNYLYPFTRYASGHSMDFVLRPGEKLIRFFAPEEPGLFYLPYKFDGKHWTEFPREFSEYHIRTADGPHSQKDSRTWATGRIEYTPPYQLDQGVTVIDMPSPYVIIDSRFTADLDLPGTDTELRMATSIDGGITWHSAGNQRGPYHGAWSSEPEILARSEHGRLTTVSGSYGYKLRLTQSVHSVKSLHLVSRIQLNPRTLPAIESGENHFTYSSAAPVERRVIPAPLAAAPVHDLKLCSENGQVFLDPLPGKTGEAIYRLNADGKQLVGFDVGARFLDLSGGLAPDKLTAETRRMAAATHRAGPASISWSTASAGPFQELWLFPKELQWLDKQPVTRLLRWPEVFKQIRTLPPNTKTVYVKLTSAGPAIDSIRLALYLKPAAAASPGKMVITQDWTENGIVRQHREQISNDETAHHFTIQAGTHLSNSSITLSDSP